MEEKFRFALSNEAVGTLEITAPVGWDDMQLTLTRDGLYHGVAIKYSLDLTYVKDGYAFLQTVYNNFGVEAEALLIIYELEPNEHKWLPSYAGRINFIQYVATEEDSTANAEETGFTRRLLNLEDIEVNLTKLSSLEGLPILPFERELEPLTLHSKAIVKRYEGIVTANQPEYSFRPVSRSEDRHGILYVGFDEAPINELDAYNYNTGLALGGDILPLITFTERGRITVDYALNILIHCIREEGDFDAAEINFYMGKGPLPAGGNATRLYHWNNREFYGSNHNIDGPLTHTINISGSQTYDVEIGDEFYFYGDARIFDIHEPLFGPYIFEWRVNANVGTFLKIRGATTTNATAANGMMAHELFSRLVQGLTGRNDAFYSELLGRTDSQPISYDADGEMSKLWLSNGSQLRGFPIAERPIFASLKEAYASLHALRPIGIGTEFLGNGKERVRLEGIEHFYQSTVVLKLGRVSGLKMFPAKEYFQTEAEIGFEKWGSNADNSLDETNTKQSRVLPITTEKGKYIALSKYVGSGYLLEQTRREQYVDKPDKEGSNDKTNFWVCVVRNATGFEPERNQLLTVANNILSPETAYNLRITPMRNFLRHGRLIRVGLRHREAKPVIFQQGNANYLAETMFAGEAESVVENQPLLVSDLAEPLWLPEYYEFEYPLPLSQRQLIEANPYGLITFMDGLGNLKQGYLKEIKVNLNGSDATFKLLRANPA